MNHWFSALSARRRTRPTRPTRPSARTRRRASARRSRRLRPRRGRARRRVARWPPGIRTRRPRHGGFNHGNHGWILVVVSKVGDFGWFFLEAWMWYFHELGLSIDRVIFIQQMYRIEVGIMATVIIEDHMTCWKGCYCTPEGSAKWGGCAILCHQGRQGWWILWLRPRCSDMFWSDELTMFLQNHTGALCGLNHLFFLATLYLFVATYPLTWADFVGISNCWEQDERSPVSRVDLENLPSTASNL